MKTTRSSFVRSNLFLKTNKTIHSVARNTSCSRGWLRLVVQMIFGAITVASFILIIMMTFQRNHNHRVPCRTVSCRITCNANYNEYDIIDAILAAEADCNLQVTLNNAMFENGILPSTWLHRLPYSIDTLSIVGGNLRQISNDAFLSDFTMHLKTLMFENVTLESLTSNTFIGLVELQFLRIRNCILKGVGPSTLRAVDNTIKTLTITGSGAWDPELFTGTRSNSLIQLTVVNFSFNRFGSILTAHSFTELEYCQDLYLNSCGITSIGKGAFDSLKNISMLFLNDNLLMTLEPGLFHTILSIQTHIPPRINLQNNLWHCDCSQSEIMELYSKGLLLVEPTCYQPVSLNGKPISSLELLCKNNTQQHSSLRYRNTTINLDYDTPNNCYYGTKVLLNTSLEIISPSPFFTCPNLGIINFERDTRASLEFTSADISNSSWLRPEFVLRHRNVSMLQIVTGLNDSYGLLWYHTKCPNEIYCFSVLPHVLRLYNINEYSKYTFCPLQMSNVRVHLDYCVNYAVATNDTKQHRHYIRPLLHAATGLVCLFFGAILVYSIIRKNPHLLKGSKRLLFVKHRSVDALVLPPKIPLRTNSVSKKIKESDFDQKNVYTISDNEKLLPPCDLIRSGSWRSAKSSSPTYISALQPTEAQLAEWRLRHHFDKNANFNSISSSDSSMHTWLCDNTSTNNASYAYVAYEHLKYNNYDKLH
ncbi:hypothetical protein evm_010757 [Chilo suppressalis]|nr:hypothetical protein evm_010757 [Chilo suppressalis]